VRVLLEHKDANSSIAQGYSEHYQLCSASYPGDIPGQGMLCDLFVEKVTSRGLVGRLDLPQL